MKTIIYSIFLIFSISNVAGAKTKSISKLPAPEINENSWVLIEIWPEVNDITLSAYFLDSSSEKNKNLCQSIERALNFNQDEISESQNKIFTSIRKCLQIDSAIHQGYIEKY